MKKISLWLVVLSMIMTMLPGTMVSAEDAAWVHVEAEAGMGVTQHSPQGYGVSNNSALIGQNHSGTQENLGGSNSITVTIPAEGEYDVFAIVGRGDVNDPSDSRGAYKFSIGDEAFFESAVGSNSIAPISESFQQHSLSMDTYAQRLYWINAGTVTLPEGDVELNLELTGHGIIDCLRFVPASWDWAPTGANLDAPVDPGEGGAGGGAEDDEEDTGVITADWFDIEAENGTYEGTLLTRTENDRTFMYTIQGASGAKTVTNSFELETGDTYDIWAVVGMKDADYLCKYEFTLGDESIYAQNMKVAYANAEGDAMFTTEQIVAAGNQLEMRWVKLAESKTLSAGANTLTSAITACPVGNALGMIDVVRFVPSDWEWVPESNFDAPTDMSTPGGDEPGPGEPEESAEWIHIEAEDGIVDTSATDNNYSKAAASAGAIMFSGYSYQSDLKNSAEVYIPATKTYDVWAVMGVYYNDPSSNRALYKFAFGEDEPFFSKYNGQFAGSSDTIFEHQCNGDLFGCNGKWVLVGDDISLTEGTETLNFAVTYGASGTMSQGFIDCIRIVPSDWEWVPESNFDAPEDMSTPGGGEVPGPGGDDEEDVVIGDNDPTVDGYVHAEAENATFSEDAYTVYENANTSSGKALIPNDSAAPADTAIMFDVTIPETQEYDVYALVAYKDYSSSAWQLLVDGEGFTQPFGVGSGRIYTININAGYNRAMEWVKMTGNVELAAGELSVIAHIPTMTAGEPYNSYFTAIDAIRIVPSDWFWSPDASFAAPTQNLATPNEDGEIILEAENMAQSGTMSTVEDENAIGGKYAISKSTNVAGSVTGGFAVEEEGTYDIYAAIGVTTGYNYLGGYVVRVDDEEVYSSCMSQVDYQDPALYSGIVMHTGAPTATATVYWAKVATAKTIGAGGHTIVIETREGSGAGNKCGLVDAIKIVPSAGGEQGGDAPEIPSETITTDWFDIQMENGTATDGTLRVGSYAERSVMQAVQGLSGATGVTNNFILEEEGTFDIWAIVGTHSAGGNLASYTFTLDGTAFSSINAGAYDAAGTLYAGPSVAGGYSVSMAWVKVAENVTLDAGNHSLISEITKAPLNSNKLGAIDSVSFIPTEWGLTKATSLSGQLAEAVRDKYFTGDYSAITEDIVLPEVEIPEIAGITISYECDDADVIAADGTVTRPFFNEEDVTVNFNVVASLGGGSVKAPIPMTVLKNTKYTIANLEVSDDIAANGIFTASADINVNASAESGITGNAALVVALYNADGSLADIEMDDGVVGPGGSEFNAAINLPADVTGMTAKVFIVNGLTMGNQLINTIAVN